MAETLSVDTCFLIDLEREQCRGSPGPAEAFLRDHLSAEYCLSVVVFGEFAAGLDRPSHPLLGSIRAGYELLPTNEGTALIYARIYRNLQERKCLIGANDLWIASCAVQHGLPLVTRNRGEFSRVEGLTVMGY